MNCRTLGIDLAKQVFQLHGVGEHGHMVVQKRVTRSKLRATIAQLPACVIGREACRSAQYWAREFEQLGHTAKLISPQFVKPYVKGNKNESRDAEAICEAVTRPHLRFVPLKAVESQDIQAIHRLRSRLIKARTALVNQVRGVLAERGIVIAQGMTRLRKQLPVIVEDDGNALTSLSREVMREVYEELVALDERVTRADPLIKRVFADSESCQKLAKIAGVGPVVATALVAAVGNAKEFTNGRHLATWLGLVPRQCSSGGKERLLGMSKRGDRYLRTLLIHGARATVHRARRKNDARSRWILSLEQRRGKNIATIAIANKNARIAWALLTSDAGYRKAASGEALVNRCPPLADGCEGENGVMTPRVSPACSGPAWRRGRFEAGVPLRRARADSLRAGEAFLLPDKAVYTSATEPFLVILDNHLAKRERSIYVATFR
jgi:transposase